MRAFFLATIFIFLRNLAFAQATVDELRTLAYAGDYEELEATLAEAHQQSLRGDISFNQLRRMVIALTVTHPTILETTDKWLGAYPTSPYANALRAFQYRMIGWQIRGEKSARQTQRTAMQAFNAYVEAGMDHAQIAYDAGPNFVPASDAIFRLQRSTKRLNRRDYFRVIEHAMAVTPSLGTLVRAAGIANPRWGGRGQADIILLCRQYADSVSDIDDYTFEVCHAHLTFDVGGAHDVEKQMVWDQLNGQYHPILTSIFINRITSSRGSVTVSEEEVATLIDYYENSANSRRAAALLARLNNPDGLLEAVVGAVDREWNGNVELINHDPFNSALIEALMRGRSTMWTTPEDPRVRFSVSDNLTDESRFIARLRLAYYEPQEFKHWGRAAFQLNKFSNHERQDDIDALMINGIHYSGHSRASIAAALGAKWSNFDHIVEPIDIANAGDDIAEQWLCPMAHLDRLLELRCEADGDPGAGCLERVRILYKYDETLRQARDAGFCGAESTATLADLTFDAPAYQLQMDELLTPFEFRTD